MSDTHRISPTSPLGEVEHTDLLSRDIGNMFSNEGYSNVTLLVEGRQFHAHRDILAARCQYFRSLLFGGFRESDPDCKTIDLPDTNANAFEGLLQYIYTGRINLLELKEDILLDILGLAHRYGFSELEAAISDYLRAILSIHNVCLIYDVANLYSLDSLKETCYDYMDGNADDVLKSENFLNLSKEALKEVISRDSFYASEINIFKAVRRWAHANPEADISNIVSAIRLPLMRMEELLQEVRDSDLLTPNSILDAIQVKYQSKDTELNYRGALVPEENIGTIKYNAQVVKGEMRQALLDGDSSSYDLDRGFTRHSIDDERDPEGIVIKLGKPSIINTIKLLLWDRDTRSYSYYIDVSVDEKDWVRIVDHSRYLCRSWQVLHFPARVCKFIKIVGVHNTVNKVFHLVSFECLHTSKQFELDSETNLIVPADNVATITSSACVIEGVSRSRNALLNGDTKNYDWDSGYTCHQLGSGSIVVQLAQPYVISSMRLLLWDCDARNYSYYIEVSTDQQNWVRVTDKTKEHCRSWQTLHFTKRPVTFIRIVGTRNTANEVFHCVHFECPAGPIEPPPRSDVDNSEDDQPQMNALTRENPHSAQFATNPPQLPQLPAQPAREGSLQRDNHSSRSTPPSHLSLSSSRSGRSGRHSSGGKR